jgi:hypothetical protein
VQSGTKLELLTGLAKYEDCQTAEVIDDIVRLSGQRQPNGMGRERPRQEEVGHP